jgi:NADPH:quinone reductase
MAQTVIITDHGGPEVLRVVEREVPAPGAGQITVRHHAVGLNYIDIYQRSGMYPVPLPAALGMEAAGVIEAVGAGVTHLARGDRVAYASNPPGAYATARTMPAAQVVRPPEGISYETGAAMMLKGMTAQYLFRRTVPIKAGDTVLFHAAAGGWG